MCTIADSDDEQADPAGAAAHQPHGPGRVGRGPPPGVTAAEYAEHACFVKGREQKAGEGEDEGLPTYGDEIQQEVAGDIPAGAGKAGMIAAFRRRQFMLRGVQLQPGIDSAAQYEESEAKETDRRMIQAELDRLAEELARSKVAPPALKVPLRRCRVS